MSQVLRDRYVNEVAPALKDVLHLDNVMEVPRIKKVVVNIGVGEALDNAKALDAAVADMTQITGQKPVIQKARMSIANFKLREGRAIGVKVTLRGERMWSFLDRHHDRRRKPDRDRYRQRPVDLPPRPGTESAPGRRPLEAGRA